MIVAQKPRKYKQNAGLRDFCCAESIKRGFRVIADCEKKRFSVKRLTKDGAVAII